MKFTQPPAQLVAALATPAASLATATAGYLFARNQELAKLAAQPPTLVYKPVAPIKSEISNQSPEVALGDFSGWQTYRNAEYGLEFRYPSSFQLIKGGITISKEPEILEINAIDNNGYGNYNYKIFSARIVKQSAIDYFNAQKKFFEEQAKNRDGDSNWSLPYKELMVSGRKAWRYGLGGEAVGSEEAVVDYDGGNSFIIDIEYSEKTSDLAYQILSTFKFIPSTGSTSSPQASSGQAN